MRTTLIQRFWFNFSLFRNKELLITGGNSAQFTLIRLIEVQVIRRNLINFLLPLYLFQLVLEQVHRIRRHEFWLKEVYFKPQLTILIKNLVILPLINKALRNNLVEAVVLLLQLLYLFLEFAAGLSVQSQHLPNGWVLLRTDGNLELFLRAQDLEAVLISSTEGTVDEISHLVTTSLGCSSLLFRDTLQFRQLVINLQRRSIVNILWHVILVRCLHLVF